MKITVCGDIHCKNDNLEKVGQVFDKIEALGNQDVVLLGDLFHFKEVIRGRCLNFVFERLARSPLRYTILVGNHDWFNLECTEHSLELLKTLPNVEVVDSLRLCGGMSFVPYMHDLDKFRATLEEIPDDHIPFIHQGVTGFDYGNGRIAEGEVGLEELARFPLVVSGHFHKYQRKDNLVYLGTPFSQDFGETNQEKYLAVLDTNTREMELIPTRLPQHLTFEINCNDSLSESVLGAAMNSDSGGLDYIRAILTGSEEAIRQFPQAEFPTVRFIERPTGQFADTEAVSEADSNPKKFISWATTVKNLDPETTKLGLEILEEVDV